MTDALAKYSFLSWLRQGISTQISSVDGAPVNGRASVQTTVTIGGGTESTPIAIQVDLLGPADVKTFDTRAITRVWPQPDVFEVEPNLFPLIEIFPADVAWRYTPAKADAAGRLRPWLGLIVLRDDEIDSIAAPTSTVSATMLSIKAGTPLPPTDQLWAWAHVHVDGADNVDSGALGTILDEASHRVVARLLCPRRLDPRTAYTAFLVPTLDAARSAVLGVTPAANADISLPAWKNDGSAVQLPAFYYWRFETSDTGDFETLARRITPAPLPATVGERPMDVSEPGMDLPQAASIPLAAESALRALDAVPTPWSDSDKAAWTSELVPLLNLGNQRLEQVGVPRTLGPPIYGYWYAASATLDPAGQPPWYQAANMDPRTRVAAGLGWQVVQDEQQQLLAGAWDQAGAIRAANAQLRQAQLAREAAMRLYSRHLLTQTVPEQLAFSRPLHGRILTQVTSLPNPVTVRAAVQMSPLRAGVLEPAYARLSRPLGPVGIRQGRAFTPVKSSVLDRVNQGDLLIAPAPPTPTAMVTPTTAGAGIAPSWLTPQLGKNLDAIPGWLWSIIVWVLNVSLAIWPAALFPTLRSKAVFLRGTAQSALAAGSSPGASIDLRIAAREGTLSGPQIQAAPSRTGFVAQELQADGTLQVLPPSAAPEDTRFRTAVAAAFGEINAAQAAGEVLRPIDLPAVTKQLLSAVDPNVTIAGALRPRLGMQGLPKRVDPLDQIMAAPSFAQPLYAPLRDISIDWILSGFGELPQDIASLAHTNERFIESYMLGANDEMGRTLLFNEYPTDQRGTYFQQFWDVAGVAHPGPDITPISSWPKGSALGDNSTRPGIDTYLVLIVRAELMRRYPNMVVYALQSQWNADGSRSVPADNPVRSDPVFQGSLGVGAGFWGFKLTSDQVRGAASQREGDAGWYFALQEHSSEPRFGLEPAGTVFATQPNSWQILAWSDIAPNAAALATITYIDLTADVPNSSNIVDPKNARWAKAAGACSSDLAYITYREPVRLLVHASRMIPADA